MRSMHHQKWVLIALVIVLTMNAAYAQQTRYWVGSGAGSLPWNSTANWSSFSGGASGSSVPVVGDIAIFDGGAGSFNANCQLSSAVNIQTLTVNGYTGSITQGATLIVTGALTFSSGTFAGGSQSITIGSFIQNGGTFNTTSGITQITGNTDFTAGIFNPNGGTIDFFIDTDFENLTITGAPILNDIVFSTNWFYSQHFVSNNLTATNVTLRTNAGFIYLDVATTLTARGDLIFTAGTGKHELTGGTIYVEKNISLNNALANTIHPTDAITIEINGSVDQYLTSTVAVGFNRLPNVRINKPSGILYLDGSITVSGPNWTVVSGIISPGTSIVYFFQQSSSLLITVSGDQALGSVVLMLTTAYNGLTVLNNLTVENLTLDASIGAKVRITGTVTVNQLLTLSGTNSKIVLEGGTIYAKGDILLTATYTTLDALNTSSIEITGSGAQKITGSSVLGQCVLPNITINKPSGTLTLFNNISLQGNWTYLQGTVDASTNLSTIFFTQFTDTAIPSVDGQGVSTTMSFHHLRLRNPYPSTVLIAGALDVNGNLDIEANTTFNNSTSYPINIGGDLNNAGTLNTNNATITFDGVVDQNITSSGSIINNLVINKASGKVTLLAPLLVKSGGQLVLTSGVIVTTLAKLTLNNLATTTLGNATSYIEGPVTTMMAFNGTRTINLPLGVNGAWRPVELTVTHNAVTLKGYTSELIQASANALNYLVPASVEYVSGVRYLQITSNSQPILTAGTVKLYFGPDDEVVDMNKLGVAVAKSVSPAAATTWTDITSAIKSGTGAPNLTGYIVSSTFVPMPAGAAFKALFALANMVGVGTDNPLPIELSSFTVIARNAKALLDWKTDSELNNDYFLVERSANGKEFETLQTLRGAGTTNESNYYSWIDQHPLDGTSYYRLKQVDYDRQFSFSNVVRFKNDGFDEIPLMIYPLPVKDGYIYLNRVSSVRILSGAGVPVSFHENVDTVEVSHLLPGLYILIDQWGKSHKVTIIR